MKIKWQGKNVNLVTVGKTKLHDHLTIQSALDAIEATYDAAPDNEYMISVGKGYWTNADAQTKHHLSHVHVCAEHRGEAVLYVDDSAYAGGTFIIADNTASGWNPFTTENVILDGLCIVSGLSGAGKGAAGPPEGALYIGKESTYPTSGVVSWDNITVSNCIIDGEHDGIQLFGMGFDTAPGSIVVQNNLIRSQHDAFTVKGGMRVDSIGNNIQAITAANKTPRLDSAADWKTTGFHTRTDDGVVNANCYIHSVKDNIYVHATNIIGASAANACAGILHYEPIGGLFTGSTVSYPMRISGSVIYVEYDYDYTPAYPPAAIAVVRTHVTDPTPIVVNGCKLAVRQLNTGASAPDTVAGVYVRPEPTAASVVDPVTITNCMIEVSNDKAASNAYSLMAGVDTQSSQITQGGNYSHQATNGTMNTLTELS